MAGEFSKTDVRLYGKTQEDIRQVRSIKKSIAKIQARHIPPPQLGL